MAEMSSVPSVNAALAGLMDIKSRGNDADNYDGGKNFTDMMMARVTAQQSSKDDIQATVKEYESSASTGDAVPGWVQNLKHAEPGRDDPGREDRDDQGGCFPTAEKPALREKAPVTTEAKPVAEKLEASVDTKAAASVVAAADTTVPTDTKALDGLKKMASMLLQAEKNGKLTLPANVKMVLEKIAGTSSTESGQVLPLIQHLLTALRKVEDGKSLADLQKGLGEATWPADLTKLFTDLQVNPGIKADQTINLGKIVKALRMLAHLAQRSITASLHKTIAAMPNEALLAVGINIPKEAKKEDGELGADALLTTDAAAAVKSDKDKKDPAASATIDAMLVDVLTQPMNIPNSQQQPSLSNNPLNPSVDAGLKSDAKLSPLSAKGNKPAGLADVSDAFARGAQQESGTTRGLGSAPNPPVSGKTPMLDMPVVDADKAAPAPAPVNAAVMASRIAMNATAAAAPVAPAPATQQVVVQIQKSTLTKDMQLSIELHPAELGRVDVKITIGRDGRTSAQIIADRPETLALLQKDGNHLEKALQQAGLNNSAQDLHYSLRDQAQQRSGDPGSRRKRSLFEGDEDAKPVAVDIQVREDGLPHRVNYHA
jgi:flagellar hook-length control protein FliK